jgi:hypothetical protein
VAEGNSETIRTASILPAESVGKKRGGKRVLGPVHL